MLTNEMTDKELLELAAKSAGIKYSTIAERVGGGFYCENGYGECVFDPLTDDGDALRLAVKLNLEISNYDGETFVTSIEENQVRIYHNGDPYAATRRAIVRAAAEIGRQME